MLQEYKEKKAIVDACTYDSYNDFVAAKVEETPNEVINIGGGEEIAICDLVKKIHSLCKSRSNLRIGALKNRPTEIWRMQADSDKAKQFLNWTPRLPMEEGLILTIKWFRKFYKLYYKGELKTL